MTGGNLNRKVDRISSAGRLRLREGPYGAARNARALQGGGCRLAVLLLTGRHNRPMFFGDAVNCRSSPTAINQKRSDRSCKVRRMSAIKTLWDASEIS